MTDVVKSISSRIQHKHDLEIHWNKAKNFVPLAGELIIYDKEVDSYGNTLTYKVDGEDIPALPDGLDEAFPARSVPYRFARFKIGDGVSTVSNLPFIITYASVEDITRIFEEAPLNV